MISTRVGYTGGTTQDPTYYSLGDHTETIQIDFDPSVVSYRDLLKVFWSSHDATQKPWSKQYKAAVYYNSDEQRKLAIETRDMLEAKIDKKVYTEIVPEETFYLAEAYHQKYYLQNVPLFDREYRQIYPLDTDFINSTAVARVNGYVAGYGSIERLQEDIDLLGLTDAGKEELQEIVYSSEQSR